MTFLDLVIFLTALTVDFSPAQAQASRFAWGCMGPQEIASGLRIVGSREPGSDIVELRNSINEIVLTLLQHALLRVKLVQHLPRGLP